MCHQQCIVYSCCIKNSVLKAFKLNQFLQNNFPYSDIQRIRKKILCIINTQKSQQEVSLRFRLVSASKMLNCLRQSKKDLLFKHMVNDKWLVLETEIITLCLNFFSFFKNYVLFIYGNINEYSFDMFYCILCNDCLHMFNILSSGNASMFLITRNI